jgi:hypothetical protein
LANAFAQLQMLTNKGEIKDYGVCQATLEQVPSSLPLLYALLSPLNLLSSFYLLCGQVFIKFAKAQKQLEDE